LGSENRFSTPVNGDCATRLRDANQATKIDIKLLKIVFGRKWFK
jgi:hypothetical protein